MEACVGLYGGASSSSSSMEEREKATKWDRVHNAGNHVDDDDITCCRHDPWRHRGRGAVRHLEAELCRARARVAELEDERRATRRRLDRFLRRLAEEKAAWKSRVRDKARRAAAAAAREEARLEREHRRRLEAANAALLREVGEARAAARQQAQGYEMERKARELMEEACSELTRKVEEDQGEVELLRRECLRLREEMEEERRMLQMAEVWREERVQMKLSDAKLALEHKYAQLNRLQAEMEAFLRGKDGARDPAALREARAISEAAAVATGTTSSARSRRNHSDLGSSLRQNVDVDAVFEHFRRKESAASAANGGGGRYSTPASPASSSNLRSESPATDLFLAKVDDGGDDNDDDEEPYSGGGSADDGDRDSCSWVGTSNPSISVARASDASIPNNSSVGASRRSGGRKNTALIRRLWRSAITESRKAAGPPANGWSPSSDRRSSVTATAPPNAAAEEQCSSSGSVNLPRRLPLALPMPRRRAPEKQSLKEKLMEARMDDHRDKPPSISVMQKH